MRLGYHGKLNFFPKFAQIGNLRPFIEADLRLACRTTREFDARAKNLNLGLRYHCGDKNFDLRVRDLVKCGTGLVNGNVRGLG
jgi:hypothetical protein